MNKILLLFVLCCHWPWLMAQTLAQTVAQTIDTPTEASAISDEATRAGDVSGAERKAMDLLAKVQDPQSVVWLSAGGEEFLALYQPALRGKAKGGVLMLHAEGQHADWPGSLAHLRKKLAQWGWNTLSISLPEPHPGMPSGPSTNTTTNSITNSTSNTPSNNESTKPGEVLDEQEEVFDSATNTIGDGTLVPNTDQKAKPIEGEVETIAIERIVAGVSHLTKEGGGKIVLYGQGLGALRAGRYWQETADNSIGAIIYVNARNDLANNGLVNNGPANSDFTLPQSLNNPRMPILDIIHSRSIPVELDAKQRAEQALIHELQAFQQHHFAEDPQRLGNTVYGFLRRHLQ